MSELIPELSPLEIRILGTLVEKQHTVPETYPLSLKALAAGCNQKTSRNPLMEVSEDDLLLALDSLMGSGLVVEASGSRVARYSHALESRLGIPDRSVALLAVLMLRGSQTAGELRQNCERMHRFADISAVEAFLEELAGHAARPLVQLLPRQPGTREQRWQHRLGGRPETECPAIASDDLGGNPELQALRARIEVLESEVKALQVGLALLQGKM